MNRSDVFELVGVEAVDDASISLADLFYLKELKQRKLYLESEITQDTVSDLVHQIIQFNIEDKDIPAEERKPIMLYISSPGGEVDSGFSLIDAIMLSKTPVYTINTGYEYSMGFLIGLAGHRRFSFPSAKFLWHDGSGYITGTASKIQDQADFSRRSEAQMRDFVLTRTSITPKQYKSKARVEWYMFADEAKKLGVIDTILGVDCDISEII